MVIHALFDGICCYSAGLTVFLKKAAIYSIFFKVDIFYDLQENNLLSSEILACVGLDGFFHCDYQF